MVKIKKRSGKSQEFYRNKLKSALKRAGANDYDADKVAGNIEKRVTDGTSTDKIREWVYVELRSIPSERMAAEDYMYYKKDSKVAAR